MVGDDGELLWESPTRGSTVNFDFIPPAPKIVLTWRAAAFLKIDEGRRLQQALGPVLNRRLDDWQNLAGLSFSEIERLTISLHSNKDFAYDVFSLVVPATPVAKSALLAGWDEAELVTRPDGSEFYCRHQNNCLAWFADDEDRVQKFMMGPRWLIEASLDSGGANTSFGAMERLAARSDDQRHLNILFLRNGMFGDEGQKLMSPSLIKLNRELALTMDETIPAASLSLHLDAGTYLELNFDRTFDLKPTALRQQLPAMFNRLRQWSHLYLDSLQSFAYTQPLILRHEAMLEAYSKQWRTGIEDKQVVANCWLPPTALHNLVAAGELMLAFANPVPDSTSPPQAPANLRELLQRPRDLSISTSPDLIILLKNLEQEIKDEYSQLPFDFEIRLMGNDLAKEGITQNQRPGEIALRGTPLRDILSEIMVQANPDKNITGPSDPRCKMVWVIAHDPDDPEHELILITTRSAAAEKSYTLPEAFQTK